MSQQPGYCVVIFGIVFFAVFLGVFFGRLYPEIVINKDSLKTSCLITNSTINSFYCPSVSCTSCTDSSGLDACNDINNYMSSFNPNKCTPNNTQACPISPQQCSNGYKCCQTCCQTCTSCSTSCSPSGRNYQPAKDMHIQSAWKTFNQSNQDQCSIYSKGSFYDGNSKHVDNCVDKTSFKTEGCSTSCTSYPCNCYCCNSVANLLCTITADVCYNADLFIDYDTVDDVLIHTQYVQQFGTDFANAENYIQNTYQVSRSYECFYDTANLSVIRWDISYNSGYIAISAVFGAVSFICFVVGTHFILNDRYNDSLLIQIESIFWMCIFIPLIILVPILGSAPLSKSDRIVIIYFICQFVTLGFLPSCLINHWRYGIIYILTIYLGIGIIVPSEPFIVLSNKSEFYGVTICISTAAFVLFVWIAHNISRIQQIMTNIYLKIFSSCQCWTLPNIQSAPAIYGSNTTVELQPPPSYNSALHINSSSPPEINK